MPNDSSISIARKKLAFFIGAGASFFAPSCLPLAESLKKQVFGTLCEQTSYKPDDEDMRLFKDFPLEFLLQVIKDIWGERAVIEALRPLRGSNPNPIHQAIAYLSKQGVCDVVITVNFDTLLEKALKSVRCKLEVFSEEDVPPPPSPLGKEPVHVYKFHGTLEKPETIFATLDKVGKPLSDSRCGCLREILATRQIIFLGYRGADTDIKPVLTEWLAGEPRSYQWNSLNKEGVDKDILRLIPKNNLILRDGLAFIQMVLRQYQMGKKPQVSTNSQKAREAVCRILGHIGQVDSILKVMESQGIAKSMSPKERIDHYTWMFRADVRLGRWKTACRWLDLVRETLDELGSKQRLFEKIKWTFEYGKFLSGLGDKKGLEILHKLLGQLESQSHGNRLKWYRIALLTLLIEYYPEGIRKGDDPWDYISKVARYAGDHVQLRAVVQRTEGILLSRLGRHADAIRLLEDSLQDAEATADNNGKLVLLTELARAYHEDGKLEEAWKVLEKAEQFLKNLQTKNPIRLAEIFEEKAVVLKKDQKEVLAEKYRESAKQMYSQIGAPLRAQRVKKRLNQVVRS